MRGGPTNVAWMAALLLAGCGGPTGPDKARDPRPVVVRTAPVAAASELPSTTYTGVVTSAEEGPLSFAVPGRVAATFAEPGSEVRQGEVLARLDDARYRHARDAAEGSLAELQARLAQAVREEERASRLAKIDAASLEEVERRRSGVATLRSSVDALRAQRDQAAWQLDEAVLRAPFTGIVTTAEIDAGVVVSAGQPVFTLRSMQALQVEVSLAEADVAKVVPGDRLPVRFPLAGLPPVEGVVQSVSKAASGGTRGFPLVVGLPSGPSLVPGLTARVAVPARRPDDEGPPELTVPLAAVVSPFGDRSRVLRVVEGRSEAVDVTIGATRGTRVAVRGDLAPGDEVVVAGHIGLVPGEPVEVR